MRIFHKAVEIRVLVALLLFILTLIISLGIVSATENLTYSNGNDKDIVKENSNVDNSNISIKTSTKPSKVSQSSVIAASKKLKAHVDKNKRLPDTVIINKYKFSMPEFFYLMSKTISYKNSKIKSNVAVKYNIKNPSKASGTWVKGKIYSYYYSIYANKIIKNIDKYNKAPDYLVTAGGNKLQYQSNIYLFASVLSKTKTKLPYYVNINIKSANPINKYLPYYDRNKVSSKILGKNKLGHVELVGPYGNIDSKIKIAYIIRIYPSENNFQTALYESLANSNLKYAYYVYKITLANNSNQDFEKMNTQLLAQEYIIPNIKLNKYNLVIDIHSNRGINVNGSDKTNFMFAPKNSTSSKIIANKIIKNITGFSYYYPEFQTNSSYYTEQLIKSGIKTIIYETSFNESNTTLSYIQNLITEVDKLALDKEMDVVESKLQKTWSLSKAKLGVGDLKNINKYEYLSIYKHIKAFEGKTITLYVNGGKTSHYKILNNLGLSDKNKIKLKAYLDNYPKIFSELKTMAAAGKDNTTAYKNNYKKLEAHYNQSYKLAKKAGASNVALNAIKNKWLSMCNLLYDLKNFLN
ncbi:hypothetical protein MARBORIA2_09640 [Methanobrevibacter arboriphilus]|jgi:hypothetical protein|uniref:Uncharacterized protein n=1 Tax=Methanobrevibacter arboriphilus TaxID=39441 RepID=A0ACA8R3M9_METAZ|nr:hypothetical protein [Methanobrevibacter arboriphilus]BBL62094.1 hypothetical protein MarbSA_11340 [Methanobrevibacter arboriphilus]GLI11874.1 hypothetical protein MARBORIA2_09640 [Methanobrevibacter arboriphilus]